nr:disease resistance protein RLM3-like [Malus domestica]
MRREEAISDKVKRAIRGSRIAVIIFSRRYADSIRCLEELVKIMECKRTMEQMVLPIFYDVDPSDVKNQSGTFAKAFKNTKTISIKLKIRTKSYGYGEMLLLKLQIWPVRILQRLTGMKESLSGK